MKLAHSNNKHTFSIKRNQGATGMKSAFLVGYWYRNNIHPDLISDLHRRRERERDNRSFNFSKGKGCIYIYIYIHTHVYYEDILYIIVVIHGFLVGGERENAIQSVIRFFIVLAPTLYPLYPIAPSEERDRPIAHRVKDELDFPIIHHCSYSCFCFCSCSCSCFCFCFCSSQVSSLVRNEAKGAASVASVASAATS